MHTPLFDTHCHYNLSPLVADWQMHWQAAQDAGVIGSIVVGTNLETSQKAIEIANTDSAAQLWAAIGIHPADQTIQTNVTQTLGQFEKYIQTAMNHASKKIVAIGETGLDYFRAPSDTDEFHHYREAQKKALRKQLEIAQTYALPVILHVRDQNTPETPTEHNAYWDMVAIVQEFPTLRYILHCLSGPQAYVAAMLQLDTYASLAGNSTYPSARSLRSLAKLIPSDRIMIETDAPFLAPQMYRGQSCEPHMIGQTALFLEETEGISLETVYENTLRCFSLKS